MPKRFIARDGFGITQAARHYLAPLINGEDYLGLQAGVASVRIVEASVIAKSVLTHRFR